MSLHTGRIGRALQLGAWARELIIGALVFATAGALGGAWVTTRVMGARVAELQAEHELQQRQAVQAALQRANHARAVGDAAQADLVAALAANATLTQERDRAISTATTGRACLRGAALRVLDGAPGLRVAGLPPASGSPDAADASAAADPFPASAARPERVVTDTDLARWALTAGSRYEECRARLHGLIEFNQATTSAPAPAATAEGRP